MSATFFVRHAETDMAGTFCGHSDPGLNYHGYAQVPVLIERLRPCNIGAIYTSDLRRARSTANAIAGAFGIPCRVHSGLREIGFGEWEGLAWDEIERRDATYARRWLAEYPNLPAPQGENFFEFEERITSVVESLLPTETNIAVVTHAGVLRTVLCRLQGYSGTDAWEKTKSYCCVIRYAKATSFLNRRREVKL